MKKKRKLRTSISIPHIHLKNYFMSFLFLLFGSIAFWIQEQNYDVRIPNSNKPIELYANQINDDLSQTFSTAINDAKTSILLMIYSLTDEKIIECLRNQSENGVSVKIICDAKASPQVYDRLGDKVDLTRRFGVGLMHQKILVIDKEKVWLGSANMTPESLHVYPNLVAALHSSQLADKIHRKAETIKEEGISSNFPQENFIIAGQNIEMWFLPDNNKQAVQRLKGLIEGAKKTVRVAMFAFTRHDLAKSVIDASKRGVNTEVVIDLSFGKGASAQIVKYLKDNNINVALSKGSALFHHKFLYIDGETLAHGSANWTSRAFLHNDDCFIVMHRLTETQHDQMEKLWLTIKNNSCPP